MRIELDIYVFIVIVPKLKTNVFGTLKAAIVFQVIPAQINLKKKRKKKELFLEYIYLWLGRQMYSVITI